MLFDDRLCDGGFKETAKALHRQEYIEANDAIIACTQGRSDQPSHTVLCTLESLLMKACKQGHHVEDMDVICHESLGLQQRTTSQVQ